MTAFSLQLRTEYKAALVGGSNFQEPTKMIRTVLVALSLIISGCSSVPLSTVARMSTFGAEDFAALNPDELRVRVSLAEGFRLNAGESWLGLDILSSAGRYQAVFELSEESLKFKEAPGGFFSEPERSIEYLLSLAPSSRLEFSDLQGFASKARAEDISIRVVPKLASHPQGATSVRVSVELRFSQAKGFFTLVDSAELSLNTPVGKDES